MSRIWYTTNREFGLERKYTLKGIDERYYERNKRKARARLSA